MKSIDHKDWMAQVGEALAALLWKLTALLPFIVGVVAASHLIGLITSGPYEFTCKSIHAEPRPVEVELINPIEPMKSKN
jgi:hypothetical protein